MPAERKSTCIIKNNRVCVDEHVVFETGAAFDFAAFARIAFKNLQFAYPKFYKMDKPCKLGILAAEYLFFKNTDIHPDAATAIVLSSASGSLDSDVMHLLNAGQPSPAIFIYTLPNTVAGELSIRYGIKGETAFFMCENENDTTGQRYAENILKNGIANSCIEGWIDYSNNENYLARLSWVSN
jgi:hypothetical protein